MRGQVFKAIFFRRRHQPSRPPPAAIRPGSPAPTKLLCHRLDHKQVIDGHHCIVARKRILDGAVDLIELGHVGHRDSVFSIRRRPLRGRMTTTAKVPGGDFSAGRRNDCQLGMRHRLAVIGSLCLRSGHRKLPRDIASFLDMSDQRH